MDKPMTVRGQATIDILRERGFSEQEVREMRGREVFRQLCGWHLGHENWADSIKEWLYASGLKIVEREPGED